METLAAAQPLDFGTPFLKAFWPFILVALGIVALQVAWLYLKRWGRRFLPLPTAERVSQMSGEEFERALRLLLEREGWRVELTPRTGDYGADLVISREGQRVVVQAKRWKKPAGIRAVQEALGARDKYRAEEAWVICPSGFTKAAVRQAKASRIRLKDGDWLGKRLRAE